MTGWEEFFLFVITVLLFFLILFCAIFTSICDADKKTIEKLENKVEWYKREIKILNYGVTPEYVAQEKQEYFEEIK